MSLVEKAKREMELAWPESDDMQDMMKANVIELLEVFSNQGHSGFSANYCINLFTKLAKFEAIKPLTGEDDEWAESYDGGKTVQNKRDGSVFKDLETGEAYWIDGIIFRNQHGATFTSSYSRVPVSFPWVRPESLIVDIYEQREN